jgi:hypothetical protein
MRSALGRIRTLRGRQASALALVGAAVALGGGAPMQRDRLPERFRWTCSGPLLGPPTPGAVSIKDPSVVFHGGMWHVYATMRTNRPAQMHYIGPKSLHSPGRPVRRDIALSDAYHCAPQVFYMRPQRTWYLVYQWADTSRKPEVFGPAYSTLAEPGKPETLTKPVHMFDAKPDHVSGWLDFWVICDATRAHLFFTSLDGRMWRCETAIGDFPRGWSTPKVVLQADVFEASHTYRLKGDGRYMTIIEAQRGGTRYYKAYVADRLDAQWKPVADTWARPFAGEANVAFAPGVEPWTDAISHGELLREGADETMTVDPGRLRFLFQGCSARERSGKGYGAFPWRLGLLELVPD